MSEKLSANNWEFDIEPASWGDILADVPEVTKMLLQGQRDLAELPVWYVLTKASGATGIPLERLYREPETRKHALGVLLVDTRVAEAFRMAGQE